jgi:acetyl-CoA C-acetyltransferase
VTALGWYLTKHAIGVYGTTPPDATPPASDDPQAEVDGAPPGPALAPAPRGRGTIESYTVLHDRDGAPLAAPIVGRLEDGRRFLARAPEDRTVLEGLMVSEGVGRGGRVASHDGANRFDPD